MKTLIRRVRSFLRRFNRIREPQVNSINDTPLTMDERIRLLTNQSSVHENLIKRGKHKGYQLVTLIKSLMIDEDFYDSFFINFIDNSKYYESQLGQDCFVDALLKNKTGGVFIEIGVGDGRLLSNTYFLEKYRGWTGLLCEPSRCFHHSIASARSAKLLPFAVFNKTGVELSFIEVKDSEELSTIKNYQESDSHDRKNYTEYTVDSITFNDLCSQHLDTNKIDYLSVDTEGSEYEIISSIDFKTFDISIISFEHNYDSSKRSRIREILTQNGYIEVDSDLFSWDSVFIKRDLRKSTKWQ